MLEAQPPADVFFYRGVAEQLPPASLELRRARIKCGLSMRLFTALALQLMPLAIEGYPEMAGSCGRPGGVHLPNAADTGDGGFSVLLQEQPHNDPATQERTASVTLAHSSRTSLSGFLLRAVDAETLAELGTFSQLAPSTMLYEGCARPAAAVCQSVQCGRGRRQLDGHDHGDRGDRGIALPALMQIAWPADRPLRLMLWAVDSEHRYYLSQTTSADAGARYQAPSELDPRLESCPREAVPLPVIGASLAGFLLVVAIGAVPAFKVQPAMLTKHYGLGGWTAGELCVAMIWMSAQVSAIAIAFAGIDGFPAKATFGRALGKLAACGKSLALRTSGPTSSKPNVNVVGTARVYGDHAAGQPQLLLATADWSQL